MDPFFQACGGINLWQRVHKSWLCPVTLQESVNRMAQNKHNEPTRVHAPLSSYTNVYHLI